MAETEELPGFDIPSVGETENEKKTSKSKKGAGGFQAMGLSFPVMKGVTKRGYKQPTPIQRKSIPIALKGQDLVAMARTGSGKTACFVLPILEKLIAPVNAAPSGKNFRALILSPTRELALQTLKFVRELGKFTGLKSAAILGGESLEQQFGVLTGAMPDIVVATPGRFLHLCVEMNLQLNNIKIVVFDEADRLFELGFGEQLREILARLPSGRQSLLFSATLPRMLVEFAKAGLTDPQLLRLDVEWKLPSTLWLGWLAVRSELRTAALLLLLRRVLAPQQQQRQQKQRQRQTGAQVAVFAATRHHVEYLHLVLEKAGIPSTYVFSSLDAMARKTALQRFTSGAAPVLLVTDVAARGLDLPALGTVVNYNFPAKPKLFVHRVGRCARAGRTGRAFSLVAAEDTAHLLDLQLFLDGRLLYAGGELPRGDDCPPGVWGAFPPALLESVHADLVSWESHSADMAEAARISGRGWQQYMKWREPASAESNKRAKTITPPAHTHPFLMDQSETADGTDTTTIIDQIRNYTPKGTILELTTKNDSAMYLAMKAKRHVHGATVAKTREAKELQGPIDINDTTSSTLGGGGKKKKKQKEIKRDENYIPHTAADRHTEMGMAVNFNMAAESAQLEVGADGGEGARAQRRQHWDRKRKKMVHADPDGGRKMIRTESGGRIPASYRSGRFDDWQKKRGRAHAHDDEDTGHAPAAGHARGPASEARPHWMKHNERVQRGKLGAGAGSKQFKDKQQIVKERLRKDQIKARLKHKPKGKGKKRGKRK